MTDQEIQFMEDKRAAITGASDFSEALTCIPCVFYDQRIITRTISSQIVGYKIIQHYIWEDAYNEQGKLGGIALQDIIEEVHEIEKVEEE